MPSFAITPASGYPPPTDQGFPRFIQWLVNSIEVGTTVVERVDVTGSAVAGTVSTDGGTLTLEIGPQGLTWAEVPGDYVLTEGDAENGISTTGTSGTQVITVPGEDVEIAPGKAVLVFQEGAAGVQFVPASGVTLLQRSAFAAEIAGQYGIVTLIKREAGVWLLCGDMAAA